MTSNTNLLEMKLNRLQKQLIYLNDVWNAHQEKLAALETRYVPKADESVRYQLEHEIENEKKQLAMVEGRIADLEKEIEGLQKQIAVDNQDKPKTASMGTGNANLRQNLVKYFNKSELLTIAFDLNIDYENVLEMSTKKDMVRTLLEHLNKQPPQKMQQFLQILQRERPHVSWNT